MILSAGFVLQMMGFTWMFVLFLVCAVAYKQLVAPKGIHWFQFLYFFSSFWGQFGPNATTWLLPGELFPTETRAMSHGISAAVGKVMVSYAQSSLLVHATLFVTGTLKSAAATTQMLMHQAHLPCLIAVLQQL